MSQEQNVFAVGSPELSVLRGLSPLAPYWTLHGGGSLAYHLRHRNLAELDFFREIDKWDDAAAELSVSTIIPPTMPDYATLRLQASSRLRQNEGVFKLHFSKITLSFVMRPKVRGTHQRVEVAGQVPVASMTDIVGVKLFVLLDRRSTTDYIDLAAIIDHGYDAQQIIDAGRIVAPLRDGNCDLIEAFQRLGDPPEEADDHLTGEQYDNLLRISTEGLQLLTF